MPLICVPENDRNLKLETSCYRFIQKIGIVMERKGMNKVNRLRCIFARRNWSQNHVSIVHDIAFQRKYLQSLRGWKIFDSKNIINNLWRAIGAEQNYGAPHFLIFLCSCTVSITDQKYRLLSCLGSCWPDHSSHRLTFSVTFNFAVKRENQVGSCRMVAVGMLTFNKEYVAGTEGTN